MKKAALLLNFDVETAFNSRSKLKLSKYGIYGIDTPKEESLNQQIEELEELEELIDDSEESKNNVFDNDQDNEDKDNNSSGDDKSEEDDPDNLCHFF